MWPKCREHLLIFLLFCLLSTKPYMGGGLSTPTANLGHRSQSSETAERSNELEGEAELELREPKLTCGLVPIITLHAKL